HTDQDDAIDALIYPSRSAVSGSAPSMRVDYSYDSADRLSSVTIPSVGTTTYTYDIKSSGETNTVSYPGQPNAMQKTMNSFAEITAINHADGWSETNGYDLFGNITTQKRGGTTYGTFAYDKLSRIKEETVQGNTRQYAYDRRGNRQAYANAPADSTRSYELKHDLLNRLTEYKDDKGTTTYTYYPGGLRATKQQTGAVTDTTHYVYLNGQVIEELTQDGRVKARNVFGNQLIWRKDYTTNQEGTYYYNSHGDVVKIKGPSGNALNTYEYDIWGNLIADKVKETMPNPFAYAGEMYDKESGFYYLRARYYDPKMGRFVSEDTYKGQVDNPLSLNRYTYVENNPIMFIDPTGNITFKEGWESFKKGWSTFTDPASYEKAINTVTNIENYKPALKALADYYVLDNIKTLEDPNASFGEKGFAVFGLATLAGGAAKGLIKAGGKFYQVSIAGGKVAEKVEVNQEVARKFLLDMDLQFFSKNIKKLDDKFLKKLGIDAHELKKDFLGKKAKIAHYDLYVDNETGQIIIFEKGGLGNGIPTGEFIDN
ncbi:MAG: RHS repeat-associated core domain-containing protein, partial [Bacillota bacterium]